MKSGLVCGMLLAVFSSAHADEVSVAVAANFTAPMNDIVTEFEKDSGHKVLLSFGSTGKLYAQIKNGAPFQMFLAADQKRPAILEDEDLIVKGSRFTYATGTLALWSAKSDVVDDKAEVLRNGTFNKLALANPKLAPYGKAVVEVLTGMNLFERLSPKFVMGENIAQTYQFVSTANADLGFVALSYIMKNGKISSGSAWIVPRKLHTAIHQDAVILSSGKDNVAADALAKFLRSDKAKVIIRSYGYQI